jgi:hypothetical protein
LALPAVSRAASIDGRGAVIASFCEEAKPLEDGAIAELVRVFDQLLIAAVGSFEVRIEAIRHLVNAAAERGTIEHVDDRPVNIRDQNLGVVTPDRFGAEDLFRLRVLQREVEAPPFLVPLADGLSRDNHDVFENLLG